MGRVGSRVCGAWTLLRVKHLYISDLCCLDHIISLSLIWFNNPIPIILHIIYVTLCAFTSGTFGSSTVSWVDPWRSTPHRCSCTASSFTGYQTSMPPEVKLILFTANTQLQRPMKLQSWLPWQYKGIQTQPHQSAHSKQDGDLSELYISLLLQHTCVLRQIERHLHKQNCRGGLLYWLPVKSQEITPVFVCKLLFSLISLKQRRISSHRGAESPFSQQQLITLWAKTFWRSYSWITYRLTGHLRSSSRCT